MSLHETGFTLTDEMRQGILKVAGVLVVFHLGAWCP